MFCIPVLHASRPVITLLHYSHNFDCIWFGCISIVHWFAILHCNCNHDHLAASTKAQTQLSIVRQSLLETKLITVTAYYLFYYTACILLITTRHQPLMACLRLFDRTWSWSWPLTLNTLSVSAQSHDDWWIAVAAVIEIAPLNRYGIAN